MAKIVSQDVLQTILNNIANSLNNKADKVHAHNTVKIQDTRETNESPSWYQTNYPYQVVTEFKYCNKVGVTVSGVHTYGRLTTYVHWNNDSGGYPHQEFSSNGKVFERYGTNGTTWSAWKEVAYKDTKVDTSTKADQLTTARTISLSGDASGSVSFNGSGNVTLPVTIADNSHNHFTNTIHRGAGTYTSGDVTVIDQTMIDVTSANRTAFMPASAITVEYSKDGGTTWTDYGLNDNQKQGLFSQNRGHSIHLGGGTTGETVTTNMRARVTVLPTDRYAGVDMFYCWFSTAGHTCVVDIERSTIGAKTTFNKVLENIPVNGWSGNNIVNFSYGTFGGGTNQTSNHYAYRFTFKVTQVDTAYATTKPNVTDLRLYGKNAWTTPNNMMKAGHIYTWDNYMNTTFPANIKTGNTIQGASVVATNGTNSIVMSVGGNDVYLKNNKSNKYLQLKDDGTLQYDNKTIYSSDNMPIMTTADATTVWNNAKTNAGL